MYKYVRTYIYVFTYNIIHMEQQSKIHCLHHLVISYTGSHKITLIFSPLYLLFPSPTLLLYDYIPLATAIDTKHIAYIIHNTKGSRGYVFFKKDTNISHT